MRIYNGNKMVIKDIYNGNKMVIRDIYNSNRMVIRGVSLQYCLQDCVEGFLFCL
jgi:hypothetical protein